VNALVQTTLKLTSAGVPDVYQGTELWDLSLVDPDNRRPVDYVLRERLLSELSRQHAQAPLNVARETWTHSSDGRCKLLLTWLLLRLRQAHPDLFLGGRYEALEVEGIGAPRTLAFLRASGGTSVVVWCPGWCCGRSRPGSVRCTERRGSGSHPGWPGTASGTWSPERPWPPWREAWRWGRC